METWQWEDEGWPYGELTDAERFAIKLFVDLDNDAGVVGPRDESWVEYDVRAKELVRFLRENADRLRQAIDMAESDAPPRTPL